MVCADSRQVSRALRDRKIRGKAQGMHSVKTLFCEETMPASQHNFHIMTKPIGPICNLDCQYCFYLEKENLYPPTGENDRQVSNA